MTEIAVQENPALVDIAMSPTDIIAKCQEQAAALMSVVEAQSLYQTIKGRKFLNVEGWQLLGSFLGLTAVCQPSKCITKDSLEGWEAYVEIRDKTGQVVAGADAQCCRDERNWKSKDDFQLRSMAQTRAISKAYRTKISFIAKMAGYESTPAEEINGDEFRETTPETVPPKSQTPPKPNHAPSKVGKPIPKPKPTNGISVAEFQAYRDACIELVEQKTLAMLASNLKLDGKKVGDMTRQDLDDLLAACQHFVELEKAQSQESEKASRRESEQEERESEKARKRESEKARKRESEQEEEEEKQEEEDSGMESFPVGEEEAEDVKQEDTDDIPF